MAKSDSFLRDAVHPDKPLPTLTYMDGFRFGFGAFMAVLLVGLIIGGVAWLAVTYLHL